MCRAPRFDSENDVPLGAARGHILASACLLLKFSAASLHSVGYLQACGLLAAIQRWR